MTFFESFGVTNKDFYFNSSEIRFGPQLCKLIQNLILPVAALEPSTLWPSHKTPQKFAQFKCYIHVLPKIHDEKVIKINVGVLLPQ